MSVRKGLLAILTLGPCYGYQLRQEFDRRTGAAWPLNVGQVYTTLDRLERDNRVTQQGADAEGHVIYAITPSGRDEAARWLGEPVIRIQPERDELAIKLALAITLPGIDPMPILAAQRSLSGAALDALLAESPEATSFGLADGFVRESRIELARAELRWLDHCERILGELPNARVGQFGLSAIPPKRGRPSKVGVE
jgi:DNA-binding PadR family transcriptional regulator